MTQDIVQWGILSTAKIGRKKVIPALKQAENCRVRAIASRDFNRAKDAADSLDIPDRYGTYADLLQTDSIDAVYIPLPNNLHVEWSIRALESDKHVLCEKPIGMNADEAKRLALAADQHPRLKIMEGFMYRHHPQWEYVKKQVDENALGRLQTIHTTFTYYKDDPGNIRNRPETGGGGLMDIGCYAVSASRFLFNREPDQLISSVDFDPKFNIDRLASGILQYGNATATFTCGTQMEHQQRVEILGSKGRIEIPAPFNPPWNDSTYINWITDKDREQITFDPCNQFTLQAERFARAILSDEAVPTPLSDAVNNMMTIDAIFESSRKNRWVKPQNSE